MVPYSYAVYVWAAYGVSFAVLFAIAAITYARWAIVKRRIHQVETNI